MGLEWIQAGCPPSEDEEEEDTTPYGFGDYWCPFCFKEWREESAWDYAYEMGWKICEACFDAGKDYEDLTPEFWENMRKEYLVKPMLALKPIPKQTTLDKYLWSSLGD